MSSPACARGFVSIVALDSTVLASFRSIPGSGYQFGDGPRRFCERHRPLGLLVRKQAGLAADDERNFADMRAQKDAVADPAPIVARLRPVSLRNWVMRRGLL